MTLHWVMWLFVRFLIGPIFVIVALNAWPKYMRAKIVNAVDNSITFLAQAFLLVSVMTSLVSVSVSLFVCYRWLCVHWNDLNLRMTVVTPSQSVIVLFVFKMSKIREYQFNAEHKHCDDVTVMSVIVNFVEHIPQGTAFCCSFSVAHGISADVLQVITRPAIHVWCKKFAHSREIVVDEWPAHAASNQPPAAFCHQAFTSLLIVVINA